MWPLFLLLAGSYFEIKVIDEATGRGVPLVELRTTSEITSWTDSNGIVAWNEPGLMDRPVYFYIRSPGYEFAGGGKTLQVVTGGHAELKIRRVQLAERLYRVTGQGIYRDSVLTGAKVPIREPVLNGMVMGQDTVRAIPYRGKLFWLWGDTNRPSGPLGNFNTTAATSALPGKGGLDPSAGIDLAYFIGPNGFVKQMIPWTGRMTWMHSLMVLRDPAGEERLVALYEVVRTLGDVERTGLAVFNDGKREFDPLMEFPGKFAIDGIAFPVRAGGGDYYYFTGLDPGGGLRVPAEWKAVQDVSQYQAFDGEWKTATGTKRSSVTNYTDIDTGSGLTVHCDSIAWNEYRKRWIATLEHMPGEVWYAEADSPAGPWVYATRVAVHGKYTFYWPSPHPFFDQEGGRVVYFEGTYTDSFSGNPVITPRYNYNQIMYRLRLDDERLFLPAPVYRLRDGRYLMREGVAAAKAWDQVESAPFFAMAPDRHREGTVPVAATFYALPIAAGLDAESAAGEWGCRSNDNLEFSLRIGERDGSIRLRVLGEEFTKGSYRAGTLTAEVLSDRILYHVTGNYRQGKITGGWKEDGGGIFTCSRPVTAAWKNSKALVPLYYYDGKYTTEQRAGATPIARVWRNPETVLKLDRAAAASQ